MSYADRTRLAAAAGAAGSTAPPATTAAAPSTAEKTAAAAPGGGAERAGAQPAVDGQAGRAGARGNRGGRGGRDRGGDRGGDRGARAPTAGTAGGPEGAAPSGPARERAGEVMPKSIYIPSVPSGTTEEELRKLFGKAGPIVDKYLDERNEEVSGVEIIKSTNASRPNTFAFITFESEESAARCISGDLQGTFALGSTNLNVRERQSRANIREAKAARGG